MAATALARSPQSLPRPTTVAKAPTAPAKLWLCAHFPALALEALKIDTSQAVAVIDTHNGRPGIFAVSVAARQAGVETGMNQSAAKALCPTLNLLPRNPTAEKTALRRLAEIGLNFSPWVSLDRPGCLLLEISSCLNLFGNADRLKQQLRDACVAAGHRPTIAIAPTAAATELLAGVGLETQIAASADLRSALGQLPIAVLALDGRTLSRLGNAGIRHLIDLWRLPRDGLAKRYGSDLLQRLDGLLGLRPLALTAFHQPPAFAASRELPIELTRLDHFFPAIAQLVEAWADFLKQRDAVALSVALNLYHHRRPPTRLELSFRHGNRDADHCLALLREKLERSPLPAPVLGVELLTSEIAPYQPAVYSLFAEAPTAETDSDWQATLDQLQNRLGHHALRRFAVTADHRPERAQHQDTALAEIQTAASPRPLWLLPTPEPLPADNFTLLSAAERIESGWWDNQALRRDYFIGQDRLGRKLWLFRELSGNRGWYLHGLFG
ncbi:Y-family DNA polymerase [Methylomonas sp. HW2-6]|uniref:Y-family DNA polymerase n=1 Tax=Methylomonas sp. HW2-6 TaxID=3376687 RepID=UPI004041D260